MEYVTVKLMQYIENAYSLNESQREIVKFGVQSALEIGSNLLISILVLYKINMIWQGILFFSIFIPIRTFAGGYHSNTYFRCLMFSVITLIMVLEISQNVQIPEKLSIPIIVFLEMVIGKIAPVINADRPVSNREYKLFAKRLKIVLSFVAIFSGWLVFWHYRQAISVIVFSLVLIVITLIIGKIKYREYQMKR